MAGFERIKGEALTGGATGRQVINRSGSSRGIKCLVTATFHVTV